MKLFIMQSSQLPVTAFLLGLNILLSAMLSNVLDMCSSGVAKDNISFAYKNIYIYGLVMF